MSGGIRIAIIDGESVLVIPMRLIGALVIPPTQDDDVTAATVELLTGHNGMSPSDLLRKLDASGFAYYPELPWRERLKLYSSHLWRVARTRGEIIHVRRGCYAVGRPAPKLFNLVEYWPNHDGMSRILHHAPVIAAMVFVLSGWWLKTAHLTDLVGHTNYLFA